MTEVNLEELKVMLQNRKPGEWLDLSDRQLEQMDLTGMDLSEINFEGSQFSEVILEKVNFTGCRLTNACLDGCRMGEALFARADLSRACFRGCDMRGCDLCGANLHWAILENADLTDVKTDEHTKWFRMVCPETGAMVGYKKCVGDRIVQLLVPADAKRCSGTISHCRCNKAKVLSIKSIDETREYEEAWSLADENFVYRKGQWVEVKDFNEDRWFISTTGIHFCLTREEAVEY